MQKLQNRTMRLILKCEYITPREFMLTALGWMSVSQRIKYNVLVMIFKMTKKLLPSYLCDKLIYNRDVHTLNTRNNVNNELRLPNFKFEKSRKNLFYNGIKLFNELPMDIKKAETLSKFKKNCKMYVMNNYSIV